jgi:hypothetical protein
MKLAEITKEMAAQIRWRAKPKDFDLSGFEIRSQADIDRLHKAFEAQASYYFYVSVWNCQACLALMQNKPDGTATSQVIEDFDSPLLYRAVEQVGGRINMSGHYPLSRRLEQMLKKRLEKVK